jgi:hypothetical protein
VELYRTVAMAIPLLIIALVMVVIAAMLTNITIVRKWENGTMEQLISTPIRVPERVLGLLLSIVLKTQVLALQQTRQAVLLQVKQGCFNCSWRRKSSRWTKAVMSHWPPMRPTYALSMPRIGSIERPAIVPGRISSS